METGRAVRGRHFSLPSRCPQCQAKGGPPSLRPQQQLEASPESAATQAPHSAHPGAEALLISALRRLSRLLPETFLPSPGLASSCWNHLRSRLRALGAEGTRSLGRRSGRAAAQSGWPSLLPSPRTSCSYKLSKLKMLLRVGDKRESWVSP